MYISSLGPEEKDLWSPAVHESSFPIVFSAMVADASVAIPSCFKHETSESCDPSVLTVIPQARKDFWCDRLPSFLHPLQAKGLVWRTHVACWGVGLLS